MSRKLSSVFATAALMSSTALADVPNVVVDIAPVHSLVARVMQDVGAPDLIIRSGASPHDYRLRPSEAKALQDANLVIWMGKELTPWMEDAVKTLSTEAAILTLLEKDETTLLEFRESVLFEEHDHDDHSDKDHAETEDQDHDDHDDHSDEDHAETEDQDHDEHAHGAHDPHAWLSPENAKIWLNLIAAQLSTADPDNASTYFVNAAAAMTEIDTLMADVSTMLDPVRSNSFIVFHDAYQYFETVFEFPASGAISLGDATDPSPARIARVQGRIQEQKIQCVLAEPQFKKGLVVTVLEGTDANTSIIDPLGVALEPGPALYPQLIRNMAKTLVDCF
ncbi:zinc ABC transporter substrate-binding protein [Paracoccaceae bacterium]|nr:zinc ABC transporter substrate-binding protein [Paracoccaceae bacterium]